MFNSVPSKNCCGTLDYKRNTFNDSALRTVFVSISPKFSNLLAFVIGTSQIWGSVLQDMQWTAFSYNVYVGYLLFYIFYSAFVCNKHYPQTKQKQTFPSVLSQSVGICIPFYNVLSLFPIFDAFTWVMYKNSKYSQSLSSILLSSSS